MKKKTPSRPKRSTGARPAARSAPVKRAGAARGTPKPKPPAARHPARRAPAERTPPDTRRRRLQKLLFESVSKMDEEGLVFLLRQAHILSSNASAELINREIEAYERERGPAPEPEQAPAGSAAIEMSPDGKSYFLVIGGARKVLTRAELGIIVRVCLGAADRDAGVRNLFRALGRERGDILVDAKISGTGSPHLAALYDTVLDMSRKS
ncbi:MAG TPA: hypothetical protein VLH81_11985 [Desulfobacterales bacterium]|nr:hypothetical protein [Desulfobacterales bacterium]